MKMIIACLLTLGSITAQEVEQSFNYGSVGLGPFPLPLPNFALGRRMQKNHHGADLSLQVNTLVWVTQVKANVLYHYYWKPSLASQSYAGLGVGPSAIFGENQALLISPEFVLGKQYRNEDGDLRFFQGQLSFPTVAYGNSWGWCPYSHKSVHVSKFPLLVLSYGFGF